MSKCRNEPIFKFYRISRFNSQINEKLDINITIKSTLHLRFCQLTDIVRVTKFCIVLYLFSSRTVNILNSLPNYTVDYVASVDLFKTCLDKFTKLKDVAFDRKADLAGIRDQSECAHFSVQSNSENVILLYCVCFSHNFDYTTT